MKLRKDQSAKDYPVTKSLLNIILFCASTTMATPHSNNHHEVKIIEQCQVAPPQGSSSLPTTTLIPLSFFDTIFLACPTVKRIFFYDFPLPTDHFLQSALPILKHSLSLTLQFFPFSSNLIVPPPPQIPFIRCTHVDSLCFTVAESNADFNLLVSDSPQDVRDWHPLFPPLLPQQATLEDGSLVMPLMAIQVTVTPNSGFVICVSFNHLAADGKSLHHFMKFWATLCNAMMNKKPEVSDDGDFSSLITEGSLSLPFLDRDIVKDTERVNKHVYLKKIRDLISENKESQAPVQHVPADKVHATLVLSRDQIEKLKKWVFLKYGNDPNNNNNHCSAATLLHMSTFVVTCSLIWVCMIQSEEQGKGNNNDSVSKDANELCYFGFLADCRGHPEFSVPSNYFGNCLLWVIVALKRIDLIGENGIFEAAIAIERGIRDLRNDARKSAENLISCHEQIVRCRDRVVVVAGSPKLAVYETNFGWGKPKKSEAAHIIDSSRVISLSDSRDTQGAIEIGFALERIRINTFIKIFEQHLGTL